MRELDVDPKVVADQFGHSLDVNLNVYTKTALAAREKAVNALESVLEQPNAPEVPSRVM